MPQQQGPSDVSLVWCYKQEPPRQTDFLHFPYTQTEEMRRLLCLRSPSYGNRRAQQAHTPCHLLRLLLTAPFATSWIHEVTGKKTKTQIFPIPYMLSTLQLSPKTKQAVEAELCRKSTFPICQTAVTLFTAPPNWVLVCFSLITSELGITFLISDYIFFAGFWVAPTALPDKDYHVHRLTVCS